MLSKSFVLHVLSAFAFSKQVLARPVVVPPHYARAAEVNTATCAVVTVTVSDTAPTSTVAATTTASATAATSTLSSSVIGDFGSCSVPEIEFGTGFGGRTETAFQPVNQTSYNHGSADNIAVITSFICLALTNTCGANALAKSTCATAASAAANVTALTGAQADAFNAVFGIETDFASVPEVSNTGVTLSAADVAAVSTAATSSANTAAAAASTTAALTNSSGSTGTAVTATATASTAGSTLSASQIGDFGSCSVPQIEFGVGFNGRKETSFQPTNLTSYNHGSADNINIITQFMCDQLVNTCGANAQAQSTCATATAAASAAEAPTGAQADAFNAVFGIKTDFAAVPVVNDQGVTETVSATAASSAVATASAVAATSAAAAPTVTSTAASSSGPATSASASSDIGNFGSCSVPEIEFGAGFNGRTETSFQPTNLTSYNHGSADNIAVITSFICGQLASACGADAQAQSTCSQAEAAASAAAAPTGAQADAFNAVFGIKTDFAAVPVVSDQGVTETVSGTAAAAVSTAKARR